MHLLLCFSYFDFHLSSLWSQIDKPCLRPFPHPSLLFLVHILSWQKIKLKRQSQGQEVWKCFGRTGSVFVVVCGPELSVITRTQLGLPINSLGPQRWNLWWTVVLLWGWTKTNQQGKVKWMQGKGKHNSSAEIQSWLIKVSRLDKMGIWLQGNNIQTSSWYALEFPNESPMCMNAVEPQVFIYIRKCQGLTWHMFSNVYICCHGISKNMLSGGRWRRECSK